MTAKDLYWIAGLLEGEGCFRIRVSKTKRKDGTVFCSYNPVVTLCMTDIDVVEKAYAICGGTCSIRKVTRPSKPTWKPTFEFDICGRAAIGLMMTLYSLMGERRKKKILEILVAWSLVPVSKYDNRIKFGSRGRYKNAA